MRGDSPPTGANGGLFAVKDNKEKRNGPAAQALPPGRPYCRHFKPVIRLADGDLKRHLALPKCEPYGFKTKPTGKTQRRSSLFSRNPIVQFHS